MNRNKSDNNMPIVPEVDKCLTFDELSLDIHIFDKDEIALASTWRWRYLSPDILRTNRLIQSLQSNPQLLVKLNKVLNETL